MATTGGAGRKPGGGRLDFDNPRRRRGWLVDDTGMTTNAGRGRAAADWRARQGGSRFCLCRQTAASLRVAFTQGPGQTFRRAPCCRPSGAIGLKLSSGSAWPSVGRPSGGWSTAGALSAHHVVSQPVQLFNLAGPCSHAV